MSLQIVCPVCHDTMMKKKDDGNIHCPSCGYVEELGEQQKDKEGTYIPTPVAIAISILLLVCLAIAGISIGISNRSMSDLVRIAPNEVAFLLPSTESSAGVTREKPEFYKNLQINESQVVIPSLCIQLSKAACQVVPKFQVLVVNISPKSVNWILDTTTKTNNVRISLNVVARVNPQDAWKYLYEYPVALTSGIRQEAPALELILESRLKPFISSYLLNQTLSKTTQEVSEQLPSIIQSLQTQAQYNARNTGIEIISISAVDGVQYVK